MKALLLFTRKRKRCLAQTPLYVQVRAPAQISSPVAMPPLRCDCSRPVSGLKVIDGAHDLRYLCFGSNAIQNVLLDAPKRTNSTPAA